MAMRSFIPSISIPTFVVYLTSILVITAQLLLCFKGKRLWIKLIPNVAMLVSSIAFAVMAQMADGWDGFGYLFFFLLSVWLLALTGFCWFLWAVIRKGKKADEDTKGRSW